MYLSIVSRLTSFFFAVMSGVICHITVGVFRVGQNSTSTSEALWLSLLHFCFIVKITIIIVSGGLLLLMTEAPQSPLRLWCRELEMPPVSGTRSKVGKWPFAATLQKRSSKLHRSEMTSRY